MHRGERVGWRAKDTRGRGEPFHHPVHKTFRAVFLGGEHFKGSSPPSSIPLQSFPIPLAGHCQSTFGTGRDGWASTSLYTCVYMIALYPCQQSPVLAISIHLQGPTAHGQWFACHPPLWGPSWSEPSSPPLSLPAKHVLPSSRQTCPPLSSIFLIGRGQTS